MGIALQWSVLREGGRTLGRSSRDDETYAMWANDAPRPSDQRSFEDPIFSRDARLRLARARFQPRSVPQAVAFQALKRGRRSFLVLVRCTWSRHPAALHYWAPPHAPLLA